METQGFTEEALAASGFIGFRSVSDLQGRVGPIPAAAGVYAVTRPTPAPVEFVHVSPGSWFKGKNPTVAIDVLQANWVPGTHTLYIGSGDDLRARVGLLLEFSKAGHDKSVFHWGGRLLWQLRDSGDLRISWRVEAKHRALEKALVEEFKSTYGVLPFANLRMPPGD